MNFLCPHCGHNAFRIATEHVDAQHAACLRCGEIIPFDKSQMEERPLSNPDPDAASTGTH